MGGFRLLGPNYTIQSLPSEIMCKCPGYTGEISEKTETELVNKTEKVLNHNFPFPKNAHIGYNMHYKVIHQSEDDGFIAERQRFREKKDEKERRRIRQLGFDNWTPWDGRTLESIATRDLN